MKPKNLKPIILVQGLENVIIADNDEPGTYELKTSEQAINLAWFLYSHYSGSAVNLLLDYIITNVLLEELPKGELGKLRDRAWKGIEYLSEKTGKDFKD